MNRARNLLRVLFYPIKMIEKEPAFWEKFLDVFFKILLPALVGVSIKIAIKMQKEKMTFLGVILSYVIGIGAAWLCSPFIMNSVSTQYAPMVIGVVAITGDKIGEFFIYKWNVDAWLLSMLKSNKIDNQN